MRKISYSMLVSLDGFIEAPGGDLSWSYPDEALHQHFNAREAQVAVYLYGRRLYANMAAYWPTADANPAAPAVEVEFARLWRSKPKVVFSTTLTEVGWNARLAWGDLAAEVNALKAQPQPGGEMSVGGAGLAASFTALGLIDEYWLYVHPVLLGGGKPMVGALPAPVNLERVETQTFGAGVVLMRYRRGPA